MSASHHPKNLRWADPDGVDGGALGQRELIIAILNLTEEVMRIADHLTEPTNDQ